MKSFYLYFTLSAVHLLAAILQLDSLLFYTKPFLMPALMWGLWQMDKKQVWLSIALFFSWGGDVLLMFVKTQGQVFFIGGLLSFLLAHVVYMVVFKQIMTQNAQQKSYNWWGVMAITFYLVLMLTLLQPTLGNLQIPVFIYATVICMMLVLAYLCLWHTERPAGLWLAIGALSFVVSDSLLAFNKFLQPLPYSALLIMTTYLFAQYTIVRGVVLSKKDVH